MCNFFSAVATKDRLHAYYGVDSHEDIISISGIGSLDRPERIDLVRLELIPPEPMTTDFEKWEYKVDQDLLPEWFVPSEWRDRMIKFLKSVPAVKKGEKVEYSNSQYWFCEGKIKNLIAFGSVLYLLGSSQVGKMLGSSRVGKMLDSSRVSEKQQSKTLPTKD